MAERPELSVLCHPTPFEVDVGSTQALDEVAQAMAACDGPVQFNCLWPSWDAARALEGALVGCTGLKSAEFAVVCGREHTREWPEALAAILTKCRRLDRLSVQLRSGARDEWSAPEVIRALRTTSLTQIESSLVSDSVASSLLATCTGHPRLRAISLSFAVGSPPQGGWDAVVALLLGPGGPTRVRCGVRGAGSEHLAELADILPAALGRGVRLELDLASSPAAMRARDPSGGDALAAAMTRLGWPDGASVRHAGPLGEAGREAVVRAVREGTGRHMRLRGWDLGEEACVRLASALGRGGCVVELDVDGSGVGPRGTAALAEAAAGAESLRRLRLCGSDAACDGAGGRALVELLTSGAGRGVRVWLGAGEGEGSRGGEGRRRVLEAYGRRKALEAGWDARWARRGRMVTWRAMLSALR